MVFSDTKLCAFCGNMFPRITNGTARNGPRAWAKRQFCSISCKAKSHTAGARNPNFRGGVSVLLCTDCSLPIAGVSPKGRKRCRGCWAIWARGKNHWNWRGGITPERQKLFSSKEYKQWRASVFERDNYTCVMCGDESGGNLEADHVFPFAMFPKHRFDTDNGRTLCTKCHKGTTTWGHGTVKLIQKYGVQ